MAKPQHKTRLSVLRSTIGAIAGGEERFAKMIGRSRSWLKKASSGQIPLSKDAAFRIAHETGVCTQWLLGESNKFVERFANNYQHAPFTKESFDRRRADLLSGDGSIEIENRGSNWMARECVARICIAYANALAKNKSGLAMYRMYEFSMDLIKEFGGEYLPQKETERNLAQARALLLKAADSCIDPDELEREKSGSKPKKIGRQTKP